MKIEKTLHSFFKKEDKLTLFEIGSCDGTDTIKYSRLFPNSTLYAFEPVPGNFKILTDRMESNRITNVHPFQLAMSDEVGETRMYLSQSTKEPSENLIAEKSSSLLAPDKHIEVYPDCKFGEEVIVKTDTIENFCRQNQISSIDFLHLDVQGAELLVLTGAKDFLKKIKTIWLEVENIKLYKNQPLRKDIEVFMKSHGFILLGFRVGGYSGDQFYVHDSFLKQQYLVSYYISKIKSKITGSYFFYMTMRLINKVSFILFKKP